MPQTKSSGSVAPTW